MVNGLRVKVRGQGDGLLVKAVQSVSSAWAEITDRRRRIQTVASSWESAAATTAVIGATSFPRETIAPAAFSISLYRPRRSRRNFPRGAPRKPVLQEAARKDEEGDAPTLGGSGNV